MSKYFLKKTFQSTTGKFRSNINASECCPAALATSFRLNNDNHYFSNLFLIRFMVQFIKDPCENARSQVQAETKFVLREQRAEQHRRFKWKTNELEKLSTGCLSRSFLFCLPVAVTMLERRIVQFYSFLIKIIFLAATMNWRILPLSRLEHDDDDDDYGGGTWMR